MSENKVNMSQEWLKQAALRRGEPSQEAKLSTASNATRAQNSQAAPAGASVPNTTSTQTTPNAVEQLAAQGREVMSSQKPTAYQVAKQAALADANEPINHYRNAAEGQSGSTTNQAPVVGQVPPPGQAPGLKSEVPKQAKSENPSTKVDVAEDKQMPLVFDFALLMFLWIVAINVGFVAIYKTFTFALVLINSANVSWMTEFTADVNNYFAVAQRFVGIGAIFLALALTFWKLRYRILKMPMPQKSLTTHDAPPANSVPEIQERIVEYLEVGLRLLGIAMTTMITLDILGILTKSPESKAPTLMLIAICVGVPLVILLTVIISSLKRKNSVVPKVK